MSVFGQLQFFTCFIAWFAANIVPNINCTQRYTRLIDENKKGFTSDDYDSTYMDIVLHSANGRTQIIHAQSTW